MVFIFVHGIYRVLHLTGAPLKVLSVEQRTYVAKMSKVVNTSFSKEFG